MRRLSGPETRTIAMPASPGAVAMAAMVSLFTGGDDSAPPGWWTEGNERLKLRELEGWKNG